MILRSKCSGALPSELSSPNVIVSHVVADDLQQCFDHAEEEVNMYHKVQNRRPLP